MGSSLASETPSRVGTVNCFINPMTGKILDFTTGWKETLPSPRPHTYTHRFSLMPGAESDGELAKLSQFSSTTWNFNSDSMAQWIRVWIGSYCSGSHLHTVEVLVHTAKKHYHKDKIYYSFFFFFFGISLRKDLKSLIITQQMLLSFKETLCKHYNRMKCSLFFSS